MVIGNTRQNMKVRGTSSLKLHLPKTNEVFTKVVVIPGSKFFDVSFES